MGVTANDLKLLLDARARGASFERTLTLGRLSVNVQRHDLEDILVAHRLKPAGPPTFFEQFGTGLNGDDLFRLLGAQAVDSMDNSAFEGATILHDLNQPWPQRLADQYDAVIDGGTLEHVFNFPVALANAMHAVKPGGRLFLFQVGNNWCGHGFYCFSPEMFYRALAPANGFQVERLLAYEFDDPAKVYAVPDASQVHRRVHLHSPHKLMLLVEARKIGPCGNFFTEIPQQFDYAQKWNQGAPASGQAPRKDKARKHSILHDLPWYARWQKRRQYFRRTRREDREFSLKNRELFKPYRFREPPR